MDNLLDLLEDQLRYCDDILRITVRLLENLDDLDPQQAAAFLSKRNSIIEALCQRFKTIQRFIENEGVNKAPDEWIDKLRGKIEEILEVDGILIEKAKDKGIYILKELEKLKEKKNVIGSYSNNVQIIPKFVDRKV